jgi:hypothetical protein
MTKDYLFIEFMIISESMSIKMIILCLNAFQIWIFVEETYVAWTETNGKMCIIIEDPGSFIVRGYPELVAHFDNAKSLLILKF